jgi:hypothetical protein
MSRILKGLKILFLFPLYIYRTHQRVEELKQTVWRFKQLLEVSLDPSPAVLPGFFRPTHPMNLVRIGGPWDGGYLVPEEAARSADVLISYGIHFDWEFEESFQRISRAKVFAYDKSTSGLLEQAEEQAQLRFKRFFDGENAFFKAAYIGNGEDGTVTVYDSLRGHEGSRVFLKFDIEGSEYIPGVFDQLCRLPRNVIGVVAEFHDLHENIDKARRLIEENELTIVHIHANNNGGVSRGLMPNLIEVTLVRDGFFKPSGNRPRYPLPEDKPCIPLKTELSLKFEG